MPPKPPNGKFATVAQRNTQMFLGGFTIHDFCWPGHACHSVMLCHDYETIFGRVERGSTGHVWRTLFGSEHLAKKLRHRVLST